MISYVIIHAFLDYRLHRAPAGLVKRPAPNENDGARLARMLSGETKGQHCAPGVPHDRYRRISAVFDNKLMEISDVASDSER